MERSDLPVDGLRERRSGLLFSVEAEGQEGRFRFVCFVCFVFCFFSYSRVDFVTLWNHSYYWSSRAFSTFTHDTPRDGCFCFSRFVLFCHIFVIKFRHLTNDRKRKKSITKYRRKKIDKNNTIYKRNIKNNKYL